MQRHTTLRRAFWYQHHQQLNKLLIVRRRCTPDTIDKSNKTRRQCFRSVKRQMVPISKHQLVAINLIAECRVAQSWQRIPQKTVAGSRSYVGYSGNIVFILRRNGLQRHLAVCLPGPEPFRCALSWIHAELRRWPDEDKKNSSCLHQI